jgi:hypothetical protein
MNHGDKVFGLRIEYAWLGSQNLDVAFLQLHMAAFVSLLWLVFAEFKSPESSIEHPIHERVQRPASAASRGEAKTYGYHNSGR